MTHPESDTSSEPTEPAPQTEIGYAEAMNELDEILTELGSADIDIDVLSARVERAALLINICRGRIRAAQDQVTRIVDQLDQPDTIGGPQGDNPA